jgi:hypothetical protein
LILYDRTFKICTTSHGMQPSTNSLIEFGLATAGASTLSLGKINMLLHCTKCDRNVLPNKEGLCPGCRQSEYLTQFDQTALDNRTILRIAALRGHATFPRICPFCGEDATISSVMTWSRSSPHASEDGGLAAIRAGVIGLIFDRLIRPREQVISFRLPRCKDCEKKALEVSKIIWDDYCLHAYCHPRFCDAIESEAQQAAT